MDALFSQGLGAFQESAAEWLGLDQEVNRSTAHASMHDQGTGAVDANGANLDQSRQSSQPDYTKYFLMFGAFVIVVLLLVLVVPKFTGGGK